MNDNTIYHPYETQKWPLFFTLPLGVLSLMGAGYFMRSSAIGAICLIGVGMTCIWLTKVLYDSSKRTIIFEQNGLRIIGGSYSEYCYIAWEELTYGCYTRNYKGHLFLLLSPNVLNPKEAIRFANRGANSSQILIDRVVVIYLDVLQDVEEIRKIVDSHLVLVDSY